MKLPYDNEHFRILENGDERLVLPAYGVGNASWNNYDDRWYRSLHTDKEGNVISCGFPKFMNLNEGVGEYKITMNDLMSYIGKKTMYATLKMDGSLLIRYVHDGKVKWRTRGSFGVGLDNAHEIEYFMKKYPVLTDPSWLTNISVLFEWVSPENKIVIDYKDPEIYMIGQILTPKDLQPKQLRWETVQKCADGVGIPFASWSSLSHKKSLDNFYNQLSERRDIEGYVFVIEDSSSKMLSKSIRLVKLKTDQYKTLHALKSNLTTSSLVDSWLQWDPSDFLEYKERFIAAYDYECFEWAQDAILNMYGGVNKATEKLEHLAVFVGLNRNLSRKEFALKAQQAYNGVLLSTAFALLDRQDVSNETWKKLILQNCDQINMSFFDKGTYNESSRHC
jgi:hypothetical protein